MHSIVFFSSIRIVSHSNSIEPYSIINGNVHCLLYVIIVFIITSASCLVSNIWKRISIFVRYYLKAKCTHDLQHENHFNRFPSSLFISVCYLFRARRKCENKINLHSKSHKDTRMPTSIHAENIHVPNECCCKCYVFSMHSYII